MSIESGNKVTDQPQWQTEGLAVNSRSWNRIKRCIVKCRTLSAMVLMTTGFASLLVVCITYPPTTSLPAKLVFVSLVAVNIGLLALTLRLQWADYIRPLLDIEAWVQQMRSGELDSKVRVPSKGQIAELAEDLNSAMRSRGGFSQVAAR